MRRFPTKLLDGGRYFPKKVTEVILSAAPLHLLPVEVPAFPRPVGSPFPFDGSGSLARQGTQARLVTSGIAAEVGTGLLYRDNLLNIRCHQPHAAWRFTVVVGDVAATVIVCCPLTLPVSL